MRITEVRTHVLEADLSEPFQSAKVAIYAKRTCAVVEIVTDTGLSGFGECFGPAGPCAAMVEAYAPHLIGDDPLATEQIWESLYDRFRDQGQKGVPISALSGVDIALWDLKGQHYGVPIYRLMGGPLRSQVDAYATGTYRKETGDPFVYIVDEVAGYAAEGFKGVKLKIGFDADEDAALTAAVREAIGPDVLLMVDANHGYDVIEAIRFGRQIEPLDVRWFEEPVPPEDLDGYKEIKAKLSIPLAGGECEYTRYGFREVLTRRAIDIVQPDTCAAGGLSECKKIADMANAFGVRYLPHVWGTAIGLAAALQLLAVLPRTPPARRPLEPILEFDRSEHPFRQAIVTTPIEHDRGVVQIPDGPGLGIEIDRAALERFTAT